MSTAAGSGLARPGIARFPPALAGTQTAFLRSQLGAMFAVLAFGWFNLAFPRLDPRRRSLADRRLRRCRRRSSFFLRSVRFAAPVRSYSCVAALSASRSTARAFARSAGNRLFLCPTQNPKPSRPAERKTRFTTLSGLPVERLYTADSLKRLESRRGAWLSRRISLHARHLSHHVPRPLLDHAPVRGIRQRRRIQQALSLSAQQGPDGTLRRVRSAHANRHGFRSPAGARRGRQSRRGD